MRITEAAMRPGKFDGTLTPTAPGQLRDQIDSAVNNKNGYLCVFRARTPSPTLATALYTGWLEERDGELGFAGVGLAALIQADTGHGLHTPRSGVSWPAPPASQSLSVYIDDILHGGITKGTVTLTGLSSRSVQWLPGLGAREYLDKVCKAVGGARWEITPAGVLNAGPADVVFVDTPTVYVTNRVDSFTGGTVRAIQGAVTQFVVDASQTTSRTVGHGQGEGTSIEYYESSSTAVAEGIDNTEVVITRILNLPSSTGTEAQSLTDASAARFDQVRTGYGVATLPGTSLERFVTPGDAIWVDASRYGIEGSTAVTLGGRQTFPIKAYVSAHSWEPVDGYGVWLYQNGSWTDLSEHVEFGDGRSAMVVSTDPDDYVAVPDQRFDIDEPGVGWPGQIGVRMGMAS